MDRIDRKAETLLRAGSWLLGIKQNGMDIEEWTKRSADSGQELVWKQRVIETTIST